MSGRIFWGFLIIFASVFLWLLPVSSATYDFRTDLKEDRFTVQTSAGVTTGNATLFKGVYDNDTSTVDISSSDSDDSPLLSSYNSTTRLLSFSGLAASTNRTITVNYDTSALPGAGAINTVLDYTPWFYYLLCVAFPITGLAAVFTGRA